MNTIACVFGYVIIVWVISGCINRTRDVFGVMPNQLVKQPETEHHNQGELINHLPIEEISAILWPRKGTTLPSAPAMPEVPLAILPVVFLIRQGIVLPHALKQRRGAPLRRSARACTPTRASLQRLAPHLWKPARWKPAGCAEVKMGMYPLKMSK